MLKKIDEQQAKEILFFSKKITRKGAQKKGTFWPGNNLLRMGGAFEGPADLSRRHDDYISREHKS
ncbi:hypothetical protein [Moorella sulfitireducens (nom. illeg.)]|uniref:hypothetical protein n=1 Tax=Neomoorella sulfitireducens TaxID=2972948 RepID=UPI0021ABF84F|nr:hypothetical protein [Moorella sulfitireducens]